MMAGIYYSISPSILEQYRLWKTGVYQRMGKDSDDLVEYIKGDYKPNIYTSRGNAYGAMIEHGPDKYTMSFDHPQVDELFEAINKPDSDGIPTVGKYFFYDKEFGKLWAFTDEEVEPIRKIRQDFPHMAYEVRASLSFKNMGPVPVWVGMRLDGMFGLGLHEFKTTSKPKMYQDREESLQAKCYLTAFKDAQSITYHDCLFHQSPRRVTNDRKVIGNDPLCWAEVESWTSELIAWMKVKPELIAVRTRKSKFDG